MKIRINKDIVEITPEHAAEAAELEAITYGAALPEDLEANMAAVLAAAGGGGADV